MSSLRLFFLAVSLISISAGAASAEKVQISLGDVAAKVRAADFTVQINAERVYQSKEAVQVARMNLLPRLNLWKLASIIGGWQNAVSVIEDLVPFLVPANWFRAKQQALFYEAEKVGMQALRANQVLTAKGIFLQAVMDEQLLAAVRENADTAMKVLNYTKLQESFGHVPPGTSSTIEVRYLGLTEDARALEKLTVEEKRTLALMIGVKAESDVELIAPAPINPGSVTRPSFDALMKLVVERAPELEQYDYLYEAARYVKREVQFSMLGTSSLSRGVMGGVFDQYPTQSGLGFGLGPSVRIVRSQRDQIEIQKEAATEVLKRQLALVVQNINSDLEAYSNVSKRLSLSRQYLSTLNERLQLGQKVSSLEFIDGSKSLVEAQSGYLSYLMRLQLDLDRIQRMTFEGDYQKQSELEGQGAE